MNKFFSLVLISSVVFQFSCKDEELPPPATLTFASQFTLIDENEGSALIALDLDVPAHGDIVVDFTIKGSAQSGVDYETTASATIANGSTTGDLAITIIDNTVFEFERELADATGILGKTVEISLARITGNALPSVNEKDIAHLLIIKENEPIAKSLQIDLSWDSGDGTPGDVDMDIILFYIDPTKGPTFLGASTSIGTDFEKISLGTPAPDGTYGLAFRYYEGMSDNVTFTSKFSAENGTLPGGVTESSFTGVYSQLNINGEENASVIIVQTFEKLGNNYVSVSDISIPDSGSRSKALYGTGAKRGEISEIILK